MANPMPRFEAGDTRQLTITYSAAPGTVPVLAIYQGSGGGTLIFSTSATSSSATAWFAFHTLVNCLSFYMYEWTASFATGPVVNRALFQIVKTVPG